MYIYPREPRRNHLRHSAEPLDRLCQPDLSAESLERPPESSFLTAGAAGAAESEYVVAEPLERPGK